MASVVWDESLPAYPLYESYQESLGSNTIRSQMDVGPAKVRRRGTSRVGTFSVALGLTHLQAATLRTFYLSDTSDGSLAFEWTHPTTGATVDFRFVSPPVIVRLGPDAYRASFALEAMP